MRTRAVLVLRPAVGSAGREELRANEAVLPGRRHQLEPGQLEDLLGPGPGAIESVERFAGSHGLKVVERSRARHDLVVEGPVAAFEKAFGICLENFDSAEHPGRVFLSHKEPLQVPDDLQEVVEGVLGLDRSPRLGSLLAMTSASAQARGSESRAAAAAGCGLSPRDVALGYGLPQRATGAGRRVAILSFGGGAWDEDLDEYFASVGRVAGPVVWHQVSSASPDPLDRELLGSIVEAALQPDARAQSLLERFGADAMAQAQATLETTMDIEIVGAVAPGCRIDVYTAPNTAGGFYAAIHAALGSDSSGSGSSEVSLPDAIAISWGRCESSWTANHLRPVDRALDVARSLGVPVCCASGDAGSCGSSGNARCAGVVFPASSPAALACGGTERSTEATSNGTRNGGSDREELVWNSAYLGVRGASGGGVSGFFARPDYQASVQPVASQPVKDGAWMSESARATADFVGRAVPDVAVHADPCSGYAFYAGGKEAIGGGTSAAAPFCAAVLACLGQELGVAVGWPNRLMYGEALAAAFQPVIRGDNDVTEGRLLYFKAGAPWNACTGLGSPLLDQLLAALRGEPAAKP